MTYEEVKKVLDNVDKIAYPKLQNVIKNPVYAQKLYDDFSGSMGELSTILQYIYERKKTITCNTIQHIIF